MGLMMYAQVLLTLDIVSKGFQDSRRPYRRMLEWLPRLETVVTIFPISFPDGGMSRGGYRRILTFLPPTEVTHQVIVQWTKKVGIIWSEFCTNTCGPQWLNW